MRMNKIAQKVRENFSRSDILALTGCGTRGEKLSLPFLCVFDFEPRLPRLLKRNVRSFVPDLAGSDTETDDASNRSSLALEADGGGSVNETDKVLGRSGSTAMERWGNPGVDRNKVKNKL
jgi:hypothetical protein